MVARRLPHIIRRLKLILKLAAAKNGIGKIYETQKNQEFYLKAYEEAVQLDPAYAPAYFNLFYHYYFRDVNKAGDYLNKYSLTRIRVLKWNTSRPITRMQRAILQVQNNAQQS